MHQNKLHVFETGKRPNHNHRPIDDEYLDYLKRMHRKGLLDDKTWLNDEKKSDMSKAAREIVAQMRSEQLEGYSRNMDR